MAAVFAIVLALVALLVVNPSTRTAAASARSETGIWSVAELKAALDADEVVLVDIRSRAEWQETGLAKGALPISVHERGFSDKLFEVKELAGDRPAALICATGGRSATIIQALRLRGVADGFVDVSEGMMGSREGKGWIRSGLPLQAFDEAAKRLPF
ncbi:MAG: sulfurtransferase [Gammaproteobacteria bacterium]|nr:MAG: sulfurtransferase [Gammaproteobacteria bacterium]